MKAIVLAGGLGTRLHPLTINLPKPMAPVANRPMMEYVVELLAKHNFKDITALLYHQPEIIKNYFGNGKGFGVNLKYVEALENYGTAGAVKFGAGDNKEPFLVISADLVTDFDLKKAVDFHNSKKALCTLVLTRVANPLQYGIVIVNKDGRIKHFLEKPSWSEVFSDTINTGIYVLDPKVLDFIPEGKEFDFSKDLFPLLLEQKAGLYGYVAEGMWKDIGSIEEYGRSQFQVLKNSPFIQEKNSKVAKTVTMEGTGVIGKNTNIADNVKLINCIVGDNCNVGRGSYLRETVIWDGTQIGNEVRSERAIVGKDCFIGDRCYLEEHSVVADDVRVGPDSLIRPHVKIWPGRIIEEGSQVTRSMVQRDRYPKSIFGPYGVTGICNIELTPEFVANLGAAYGAFLGKGGIVTASRDSHKASRMIYRALLSGILSSGVNVSDLEMMPIPVTRYELKAMKTRGGFHVRKSPYDTNVIDIKFFDDNGMELSSTKEKKIERLFYSEDFKRIEAEEVGELSFPYHRVAEQYKAGVVSKLNLDTLKKKHRKVVIDYSYSSASQLFPAILGELGFEVVALNSFIDETRITKNREEFDKSLHQLSTIVKSLEADLGIMMDSGAEKIFICNEKGKIYSGNESLAIMLTLVLKNTKKTTIAVPVDATSAVEKIAKAYGAKVIRTKTSSRHMMEVASQPGVTFLGENVGGYIFPDFQPHYDALFSTAKLIELLNSAGVKLSEIEVPEIKMVKKDISCSSEFKGKVLRTLADELKEENMELVDGVKVHFGEDWILILPHPTKPVIELYAEGENARKLISQYTKRIDEILG